METKDEGSITSDYGAFVKSHDQEAVRRLWERYYDRLCRLARRHLRTTLRRMADEEDVALSAFDSFCAAAVKGRFPRLEDRDDLWKILMTITVRKAADLANYERRRQPRTGRLFNEADLGGAGFYGESDMLSLIAGSGPSPEFAAAVAEECGRRLEALDNDELRRIVLDRLAGFKDREIAARLGCTRKTVQRKLAVIRNAWQAEVVS
jgi:DNA-directed RNA polymerase specialized sigma24 family protein